MNNDKRPLNDMESMPRKRRKLVPTRSHLGIQAAEYTPPQPGGSDLSRGPGVVQELPFAPGPSSGYSGPLQQLAAQSHSAGPLQEQNQYTVHYTTTTPHAFQYLPPSPSGSSSRHPIQAYHAPTAGYGVLHDTNSQIALENINEGFTARVNDVGSTLGWNRYINHESESAVGVEQINTDFDVSVEPQWDTTRNRIVGPQYCFRKVITPRHARDTKDFDVSKLVLPPHPGLQHRHQAVPRMASRRVVEPASAVARYESADSEPSKYSAAATNYNDGTVPRNEAAIPPSPSGEELGSAHYPSWYPDSSYQLPNLYLQTVAEPQDWTAAIDQNPTPNAGYVGTSTIQSNLPYGQYYQPPLSNQSTSHLRVENTQHWADPNNQRPIENVNGLSHSADSTPGFYLPPPQPNDTGNAAGGYSQRPPSDGMSSSSSSSSWSQEWAPFYQLNNADAAGSHSSALSAFSESLSLPSASSPSSRKLPPPTRPEVTRQPVETVFSGVLPSPHRLVQWIMGEAEPDVFAEMIDKMFSKDKSPSWRAQR